jgi:hypothetical protein
MQLSPEEQKVFNEQVEKIKALKLSSCASDALRNLLADEKSYDYFIGLGIPELYEIYRDLIVYPGTLTPDVYEIQPWCRFRNYETFLIWTMLQQHADNNSWSESDWLFQVAHDLHTTSSAKNILPLLNEMQDYERIDFFQKIDYRLAAPLLVEMEPHDAAKIIDWLWYSPYDFSTHNTPKLIEKMFYLSDSDYRTANICVSLSKTTITNVFPNLEVDMTVDILAKAKKEWQDHFFAALIHCPDYLALVFTEWNASEVAWFLEKLDESKIIAIFNHMFEESIKSILRHFRNATTVIEISQKLWYS